MTWPIGRMRIVKHAGQATESNPKEPHRLRPPERTTDVPIAYWKFGATMWRRLRGGAES